MRVIGLTRSMKLSLICSPSQASCRVGMLNFDSMVLVLISWLLSLVFKETRRLSSLDWANPSCYMDKARLSINSARGLPNSATPFGRQRMESAGNQRKRFKLKNENISILKYDYELQLVGERCINVCFKLTRAFRWIRSSHGTHYMAVEHCVVLCMVF